MVREDRDGFLNGVILLKFKRTDRKEKCLQ